MIGRLKALAQQLARPEAPEPEAADRVPLAMAALLVEAARASPGMDSPRRLSGALGRAAIDQRVTAAVGLSALA